MLLEEDAPRAVAEACRGLGRTDDVGEQDRSEHAVDVGGRAHAGEEFLHFVEHCVLVPYPRQMIDAGELDQARTGDVPRQEASFLDVGVQIAHALQDQRRHANRRQHGADIDLRVHPQQRNSRTGTGGATEVGREPARECFVPGLAGH